MKKTAPVKTTLTLQQLTKFKPHPKNPREHTPEQVQAIAESILRFGFLRGVVVRKGLILAGEGSILAAKKLGLKEVPVIVADHLTDEQALGFMLSDNKLNQLSDWEPDMLAQVLGKMPLEKLEVDEVGKILPGFTREEVDAFLTDPEFVEPSEKTGKAVLHSLTKKVSFACKKCGTKNVVRV